MKSYHAWLAAWELPLSFHPAVVQDWLVDYAREGNCARSLDGRLTALRRYARSVRRPFPVFGSYAWDDMKDTVKACKKVEPTKLKKATVVDVHWLRRIAGTLSKLPRLREVLDDCVAQVEPPKCTRYNASGRRGSRKLCPRDCASVETIGNLLPCTLAFHASSGDCGSRIGQLPTPCRSVRTTIHICQAP